MPIYEYVCSQCGHEQEFLQKMSDAPLKECPACHAEALQKKVSAAGFRLAGSGWYETDFKSSGKRNLAGDAGKSASSSASSASDSSGSSSAPKASSA